MRYLQMDILSSNGTYALKMDKYIENGTYVFKSGNFLSNWKSDMNYTLFDQFVII